MSTVKMMEASQNPRWVVSLCTILAKWVGRYTILSTIPHQSPSYQWNSGNSQALYLTPWLSSNLMCYRRDTSPGTIICMEKSFPIN